MSPGQSSARSGLRDKLVDAAANFDYIQFAALAMLTAVGLVFIHSIGEQIGTPEARTFFSKQLIWVIAGVVCYFLAAASQCQRPEFRVIAGFFYAAAIFLLVIVLVPGIGVKVSGARSWLNLPGLDARLQPSEFTKLAVVMLLATMLSADRFSVNKLSHFLTAAAVTIVPVVLILLEPDFGSAIIFLPIFAAMVFAAGLRWRSIICVLAAVAVIGGALGANEYFRWKPLLHEYQRKRIDSFFNPEAYANSSAYQQIQSRCAVGSGGLTGKGLGESTQNALGFMPRATSNNDFIFSIIAEEVGFAGCVALLAGFAMLLYSILRTAYLSGDYFGRYLCVGIAAMLFTHWFINVGMNVGMTPVTGIPLPFISYGGSFYLMLAIGCGLVQSVFANTRQE